MIFVTVGTHEQQFNRLVKGIDDLKEKGVIKDDVMIQTGYSDYVPRHCAWKQWISYKEMLKYVEEADIVITHGGPSSFIMPLQMGKIPVVVPRRYEYNEHVNNHQLDFARKMNREKSRFIMVEDMADMEEILTSYEQCAAKCSGVGEENNKRFNQRLNELVEEMMQNKNRGRQL